MENFGPTSPTLPYPKVAENIIDVEDAKNLSVQSIVFIPVQAPALFINIHFCMKKYCEPIKLYFNSDLYDINCKKIDNYKCTIKQNVYLCRH